jgi:hypothetical protein
MEEDHGSPRGDEFPERQRRPRQRSNRGSRGGRGGRGGARPFWLRTTCYPQERASAAEIADTLGPTACAGRKILNGKPSRSRLVSPTKRQRHSTRTPATGAARTQGGRSSDGGGAGGSGRLQLQGFLERPPPKVQGDGHTSKEDHNFYYGCMEEIAEADRRQDPRPTEELSIGGIKTRALVDSGATISAMAATLFRSIPASEILSKEYSPGLRITAASNQKMSLVGVYTVRMSSEKLGTFQWPLAVMESMASDVILGVDFLSEFEATIQVKQKEVKYAAIPRTGTVRAQTEQLRWRLTAGRK